MFQEFAGILEQRKAIRRDEVVVDAVLLAGTRRSRGVGHRQANAALALQQRTRETGLAAARWRGDHEQVAWRSAHARFTARARIRAAARSFYVLHLLAHLLDEHLDLERRLRQLRVDGFRPERIRFAVELLHQKVESFAAASTL